MKTDENIKSDIYKKKKKIKENINNSYFSIMKKKELKEMKSGNISSSNKVNNILFINNNSEEKIHLKSNSKNNNNNINSNSNNQTQTKAQINPPSKKNMAYFSQKSPNKLINNSTNNIHNHNLENKDMIKIKMHKNNKETSIKKYSNKNYNIKINNNNFTKDKIKRSISPNINNNYNNLRHTANIKNSHINKLESNFFLNEIIIDLSKHTNNNSNDYDDILKTHHNNLNGGYLLNNTTKNSNHKHISPRNTFKTKKLFSSLCSKISDKENKNLINNFNSTYTNNNRFTVNKNNHVNINVDNILNTENKENKINIKERAKLDINIIGIHTFPNRKVNIFSDKKDMKNIKEIKNISLEESLIDIQIPSIPEENIKIIPLKIMKYNNQHMNLTNKDLANKINKILYKEKIIKCILLFLSNEDLYNLSSVNYTIYKIIIKLILNIIFNKIVKNINNINLVRKIWNKELLKYSNFINMNNNIDIIYHNYKKSSTKYDTEIIKDLLRTFPKDSAFQRGSACYQKLFNILKVYSNFNNEIGYAQGMNFIVAKLIKFFDNEKDSFIYLDSLFNKLKMVEVIGINNNLEKKMKMVQFLLKSLCPDILYFLESKKINHEIFTAKWYITLFSKNFKFDNILMVIWNFAIIFGWKFIFLFSISVIVSFKERYINLDLYDFTQYMKNIFVFEHFKKKFNDVMNLTFSYMAKWKNIIKKMDVSIIDKKGKINENKFLSEKDEEETDDNNENYKDKEEIIFNDDYAFT